MASPTLGTRLRELRQAKKLTLAGLSAATSVSVSYLNDIEHDRSVPTLAKLVSIADALGLSVRALFKGVSPYDRDCSLG